MKNASNGDETIELAYLTYFRAKLVRKEVGVPYGSKSSTEF